MINTNQNVLVTGADGFIGSHLTEALVRACWCIKERGLDLYVYGIGYVS